MSELPESTERPRTDEEVRLWNLSQLFLIRYQIKRGLISTVEEFVEGTAPLFELIGERYVVQDPRDWQTIIDEAKAEIKKLQDK